MQLILFSVYDAAVGAFIMPFFLRSKGEAIRAFSAEVNNPQSNFNKSPKDFTLFQLASFDDNTAEISLEVGKLSLGNAVEFLSSAQAT
nr:MAG: nonstructural protein [Microvirus sp.]